MFALLAPKASRGFRLSVRLYYIIFLSTFQEPCTFLSIDRADQLGFGCQVRVNKVQRGIENCRHHPIQVGYRVQIEEGDEFFVVLSLLSVNEAAGPLGSFSEDSEWQNGRGRQFPPRGGLDSLAERLIVIETFLMLEPDGAGPDEESCPAFSTLL